MGDAVLACPDCPTYGACLPAAGWSHDRGDYLLLRREGKVKAVHGEAEEGAHLDGGAHGLEQQ